MKHVWKMLMAALLACMLLVPVSAGADAETMYGEAQKDGATLRVSPENGASVVVTIDKGDRFEIVDFVIENTMITWMKVSYKDPVTGVTSTGYIAWGDGKIIRNEDQEEDDTTPTVPETPAVTPEVPVEPEKPGSKPEQSAPAASVDLVAFYNELYEKLYPLDEDGNGTGPFVSDMAEM